MYTNPFMIFVSLLLLLSPSQSTDIFRTRTSSTPSSPHIIFIVMDDAGFADVQFTRAGGGTLNNFCNIHTPNLNSLSSEGVILDNYYVLHLCSPSRSAFLGGRHPIRNGLQHGVILDALPSGLPLDISLLPSVLKTDANYYCSMTGKYHLGFYNSSYLPFNRGFDEYYGYFTGNADYFNHTSPCFSCGDYSAYDLGVKEEGDDNFLPILNETGTYSTNLFTSRAEVVINRHTERMRQKYLTPSVSSSTAPSSPPPLFYYLAYEAVHGGASCDPNCDNPYGDILQAPPYYVNFNPQIQNANRSVFGGMVAAFDEAVGNVTRYLKETGMFNDSIIIFTSDNGAPSAASGFNGTAMSNDPLKGQKGELWEGGVHVGAFVVAGSNINFNARGTRYNGLFHAVDWYPTILNIAGIPPSKWNTLGLDGYDMWGVISNTSSSSSSSSSSSFPPSPRAEALIHIEPVSKWTAIRSNEWKLLTGMAQGQYWTVVNENGDPKDETIDSNTPMYNYGTVTKSGNNGVIYLYQLPNANTILSNQTLLSLLHLNGNSTVYLYNITMDPRESNNLAIQYYDTVAYLLDRLAYYGAQAVPVHFPPPDPNANPMLHNRSYWYSWE